VIARAPSHRFTTLVARQERARGFTLIELLVAAAIAALLASLALPLAELGVKRGREAELRAALRDIRGALDAYKQAVDEGRISRKAGESGYPPNLRVLTEGVDDERNARKTKIVFLRRLPRDPTHADTRAEPAQTWGLRSYDSSADDPREGRDVFDVHSLSPGTGLNGMAYRRW
jgi:general secretion pathway protein G